MPQDFSHIYSDLTDPEGSPPGMAGAQAGALGDPADAPVSVVSALAIGMGISACGGGGGGGGGGSAGVATGGGTGGSTGVLVSAISDAQASRFLSQAAMGPSRDQISRVQALGFSGWLDEQIQLPRQGTRWDWLLNHGFAGATYKNTESGFDAVVWQKLIAAPDTLRQRVTLALSEILVVGIDGLAGGWRSFTAAAYLDTLEEYAFGNYRALLEAVSRSPAMGEWLTYRGNAKANSVTGALPDENYAREVMQLFTIGLVELNPDGTPVLSNGAPKSTYTLQDIMGLARVFTGWEWDLAGANTDTPDFQRRPMQMNAARHETGTKSFLGYNIAAGTDGLASLRMALDTLFAHPNVGPFIGRQLIQRLVTSNPSPAYVGRVAAAFNNDGKGVKGNLAAVIKAILLDDEARNEANRSQPSFGKLREPMLRLTAWARAFNATSASEAWALGNTSDPATRLAQSPLRSPSVFNFFRPGYVPPSSKLADAGLVGPEFQIVNESSVVGYINYMQRVVSGGIGDVVADYGKLLPLADNAQALLTELNTLLAAGDLSASTLSAMRTALDPMPSATDAARKNRIYAALVMLLAAPEFIVQK